MTLQSQVDDEALPPMRLAAALNLYPDLGTPLPPDTCVSLPPPEAFADRRCAFACADLSRAALPVRTLLSALRRAPKLRPPRTGHIGNWDDVALGRAGAIDFNRAIIDRGVGYPLVYSLTRTESSDGGGDQVYLPGSLIAGGERSELPLYTWDGSSLRRRERSNPLFTPFVMTEWDGARIPLVSLQWQRMLRHAQFGFRQEEAFLLEHANLFCAALEVLLEQASRERNPRAARFELFSHQVTLDGHMERVEIEPVGDGSYRMGAIRYASGAELAAASMLPYLAAARPDEFFGRWGEFPPAVPRVSSIAATLLLAFFNSHYPNGSVERATMTRPFNPHVHWGARDMAGYPPVRPGYFMRSGTLRTADWICRTLVNHFQEFDPLLFVLAPAAVFMLCPTSEHPQDVEWMNGIIASLRTARLPEHVSAGDAQAAVDALTRRALVVHAPSAYFRARFVGSRAAMTPEETPEASHPVEPEGFLDLTLSQACMLVGALSKGFDGRG